MCYEQLKAMTAILSESKEDSDLSDTNCDIFFIYNNIFS